MACQSIARRGLNVDAITMFWGPGGVGLSVLASHMHAMYDHLHRYFDPNVFYTDEELRKVVERLVGGIMFTGRPYQEVRDRRVHCWAASIRCRNEALHNYWLDLMQ